MLNWFMTQESDFGLNFFALVNKPLTQFLTDLLLGKRCISFQILSCTINHDSYMAPWGLRFS